MLISEIEKYTLPPDSITLPYFMSDAELMQQAGEFLLFDVEVFSNYFLASFRSYTTGKIVYFERSPSNDFNCLKLRWILENCILIGFNSRNYDIPLLWAAADGLWTSELKNLSDAIIFARVSNRQLQEQFHFSIGKCNSIDLQNVAPGVQSGLKQYGARMHVRRLQELPVHPNAPLTIDEADRIRYYNFNDLEITGWLFKFLEQPMSLRRQLTGEYGVDLRSKSDAQISETVIASEFEVLSKCRIKKPEIEKGKEYYYNPPKYMKFASQQLQNAYYTVCNAKFTLDAVGKLVMPTALRNLKIALGNSVYRMGIGGLHSCEKRKCHTITPEILLIDRDVESYYPAIILNQGLYPEHIGPAFLEIYRKLVDQRIKAKKAGDKSTSESLKITINGCFGKLGNEWSYIYAPQMLIQVTLTGQLSLLMLIEMLEWHGIPVISGNTDGIVIKCPKAKYEQMLSAVNKWEELTGFKTEETRYQAVYSRDVNNYIAITNDGKIKAKGAYSNSMSFKDANREQLMKNPNGEIIIEAVCRFLHEGKEIEKTIRECRDIRKFLFVRKVKGGAAKDKIYLGKVIRWYMKYQQFGSIVYCNNGKRVAETEGAYPLLVLPEQFPKDIDYGWYVRAAQEILGEVGYYNNQEQLLLF